MSFLSKYEEELYAILRIVAGFLFLWHGSQKLLNFPPLGHALPMHVFMIAGPIELIGGTLIMIGLFARYAAFFASGEMAYAYWTVHAQMGWLPLLNMGELAVLYCFLFLFIVARGSGVFSVDHWLARNGRGRVR